MEFFEICIILENLNSITKIIWINMNFAYRPFVSRLFWFISNIQFSILSYHHNYDKRLESILFLLFIFDFIRFISHETNKMPV